MTLINLVLGDWSGDGHNRTKGYVIDSSVSFDMLENAHHKGCKVLGFSFENEAASEYEDPTISVDHFQKIIDHIDVDEAQFIINNIGGSRDFYSPTKLNDPSIEMGERRVRLTLESYAALWLMIAKIHDPTIIFKVNIDNSERINIGGYGLFCYM